MSISLTARRLQTLRKAARRATSRCLEPLEQRQLMTGTIIGNIYLNSATVPENFTLNQDIAGFSDSSPDPIGNYTAVVDYGDGSPAVYRPVTFHSNDGLYWTTGFHQYTKPGAFTVKVTMYDGIIGLGNTSFATSNGGPITVTPVNDAPIGNDEPLGDLYEDSGPHPFQVAGLLANDLAGPASESDEDAQSLSISAINSVVGGTAVLQGDRVVFTPSPDFSGEANFVYTIRDNGTDNGTPNPLTTTAKATFRVREVNDSPTAGSDQLADVAEDSASFVVPLATLIANDSAGPSNEQNQTLRVTAVSDAVGGTAVVQGVSVRFTPAANFNGIASFKYTITDDGKTNADNDPRSATATAFFSITPVNDVPVAANDTLTDINGTGPRTIPVAALTVNDQAGPNENNQTLSITGFSNVVGGTIAMTSNNLVFTPTPGFDGVASFTYTVTDNGITGSLPDPKSATATVSFNVVQLPSVSNPIYTFDSASPGVQVTIPANMNLDLNGITIVRDGPTSPQTVSPVTVSYDANTRVITAKPTTGVLADGTYHLSIYPTAIMNRRGETLNSPYRYDFFVLAGDANRDRKVDFSDLVILAQNYNATGKTFSQGNFNYSGDGKVDFEDLVLVARNYNVAFADFAAITGAPAEPTKTTRAKRMLTDVI